MSFASNRSLIKTASLGRLLGPHKIAAGIMKAFESEGEAMKIYETFLAENPGLNEEDVAKIKEIISDENNHALILMAMAQKYSGAGIAKDDAKPAIKAITQSLT